MLSLNGILPPVPTAFDKQGDLFLKKIQDNLIFLNKFDLRGYLILGSNGELVMLSEKERIEVLKTARTVIPEDKVMMAGTGCQSTRQTMDFTCKAAELGADVALVLNPYYYRASMNQNALVNHYMKVADASSIPIVIYNMPANSGIDMDSETIYQISQHPNIIGLKDSGGNVTKIGAIHKMCGKDFQILAGGAGFFLPALTVGATGGILALANILPQLSIDLYSMFLQGEMELAKELQIRLISINTAITKAWGIPALKEAMDMIGLYGGPVREPLLPIEPEKKEHLRQLLDEVGIPRGPV